MRLPVTTMSKSPDEPRRRVEVITSVQRRRRWSAAEKVRLVEEAMQPGMSVSYVAPRAGISPSQLFAWKRRMLEGGHAAVQADEDVVGASQVRELEKQVRDLERMLGKKTMEAEILKEALDLARPKTDIAVAVAEQSGGRYAMSAVARTLGVSRSNRLSAPAQRSSLMELTAKLMTLLFLPNCVRSSTSDPPTVVAA
jgi:transposase